MFGLIVSDPQQRLHRRDELAALLHDLDLPLTAYTADAAPLFSQDMSRAEFLRTASAALLQPGQPLPLDALLTHLSSANPMPCNVLRRYLFLQFSLLPYLRSERKISSGDGYFLLGDALLVAPVSAEDTVDIQLPPGIWTELNGTCHAGRLRGMRGYNEMPVLARENALIPIGVHDRSANHDDADRLTLHWYQPREHAVCTLADGTCYRVERCGGSFCAKASTDKAYHLFVHQDGLETLIC